MSKEAPFIELATAIKRFIRLGVYKPGDQLPSCREIALTYSLNPNTAMHAYNLLEKEGYIEAIPKKGYFVLNKKEDMPIDPIFEAFALLAQKGYSKEQIKEALEKWKS